jgi:thiamine biosynthesis protein ThiS
MTINFKYNYFLLNGNRYFSHKKLTILDIINYFGYSTSLLVLEHNGFVSNKDNWNNTFVQNNDIIEIITIVGGG